MPEGCNRKVRLKIVYMGTPEFSVPPLRALVGAGHEILGVVTQPDRRKGRGKTVIPPPVKEAALSLGLPVLQPIDPNAEAWVRWIGEGSPDVIVTAAFGRLLKEKLLTLPPLGCLNLHASLLPRYRGAAPVARAIMNGDAQTGVTVIKMDKGMDTGPILAARKEPIRDDDTTESLSERLSEIGAKLLLDTLDKWAEGRIDPIPQDASQASYAPPLKKQDGKIDWTWPAMKIERHVRAMFPWPGAFARVDCKTIKIYRASVVPASPPLPPGHGWIGEDAWLVGTGDGNLSLLQVQMEGRKRLDIRRFLRGFKKRGEMVFEA